MTSHAIARRYANALFDVALRSGGADQIGADLTAVVDAIRGHDELGKVLETPMVPPQKKRAVVEAIFGPAGVAPEIVRLLGLLADRDRLSLISEIADRYGERLRAAQHIVPADVVTAVPLADGKRAEIAQALGRAVGGEVQMRDRVDPSILGGVIARIGSVVYDGSVVRQLDRLHARLLEDGK